MKKIIMSYNKILSEISNPIRMNILLLLNEKKSTISELKEKIGEISHSEISRHIGRLAKQNLIIKNLYEKYFENIIIGASYSNIPNLILLQKIWY